MNAWAALLFGFAIAGEPDVVLYDFRSDACGPCRQMDPIVAELKASGAAIRVVDVQREPELAKRFQVTGIPCFVAVVDGREVGRRSGRQSREELVGMLQVGQITEGAEQVAAQDRRRTSATTTAPIRTVSDRSAKPRLSGNAKMVELEAPRAPASEAFRATGPADLRVAAKDKPAPVARPANPSSTTDPFLGLRDDLLQSSVRLLIVDDKGRAFGSGTIIDSRQGEALILTCGHIFREWNERTKIHVDFFGPQAEQQVPARVIRFDLKSDVAILSVSTRRDLRIAKVAKERAIAPNQQVMATGCEHGHDVEAFATRVTKIDKYLGPPNLCIAGQPQQGRSGGGLFDDKGRVVGVCNAADKQDDEGLYAALGAIHTLLDQSQLGFVYREDAAKPIFDRELDRLATHEPPAMPRNMPGIAPTVGRSLVETSNTTSTSIPAASMAMVAAGATRPIPATHTETSLPTNGNAEVICIVRSHDDPQGRGRVIHLENVGPEFLSKLAEAQRTQTIVPATASIARDPRSETASPARVQESLLPAQNGLQRTAGNGPMSWPR